MLDKKTELFFLSVLFVTFSHSFPVFVLVVPSNELRKYMLVAHKLGMTDGKYVFIQVDDFTEDNWMRGNATWFTGDGRDDAARQAMETVFWVGTRIMCSDQCLLRT